MHTVKVDAYQHYATKEVTNTPLITHGKLQHTQNNQTAMRTR